MGTADLKRIRSEAAAMTLDGLREAHREQMALWAQATITGLAEAAQYHHEAAGEIAEVFQRAAFPRRES